MKERSGDIFEFSINDNSKSYGQIVCVPNKQSLAIVIFKEQFLSRPSLKEIVNSEVLFFGLTFDAKLYNKHWVIIGNNTDKINDIHLPYYKLGTEEVIIETFDKQIIGTASQEEIDVLEYRTIVSPVAFELALKAYYHQTEWTDRFEKLLYSRLVAAIDLVNKNRIRI